MGAILACLAFATAQTQNPFLFPILPAFREIEKMSPADKAKAFFTYATWGPEAIHLLAGHLDDENEKDANFAASVLSVTKTPVRQEMIRLASSVSREASGNKATLGRMRFVIESNPSTRSEWNLRMLANEDSRIRQVGIDIASHRKDRESYLPDKFYRVAPEICGSVMKELDIDELLGAKGAQQLANLALESQNPDVRKSAIYGLRHATDRPKQFFRILGSQPKADVIDAMERELVDFRYQAADFPDLVALFRCHDPAVQDTIENILWRNIVNEPTPELFAALDKDLGPTADDEDERSISYIATMHPYWPAHRPLVRKAYRYAKELRSSWLPLLALQFVKDRHYGSRETDEAREYLLRLVETDMEPAGKNLPRGKTYYESDVIETLEAESKRDAGFRVRYMAALDRQLRSNGRIWYLFELAESMDRLGGDLSKYRSKFVHEYQGIRELYQGLMARMGGVELDMVARGLDDPNVNLPSKDALFNVVQSAWDKQPDVRRIMELQLGAEEPTIRARAALALAEHGVLTPKSDAVLNNQLEQLRDVESLLHLKTQAIPRFLKAYRVQLKTKTGPTYGSVRALCDYLKKNGWNDDVFQVFCDDLAAGYSDHESPYRRVIVAEYLAHAPKAQVERILRFVCDQLDRPSASMPAQPSNDIYIPWEDAPRADGWHAFSPFFDILGAYAPTNLLASAKLIDLLKSPDSEKKSFAIREIAATTRDPQEVKRLIEPLLHDPSLGIRRAAAYALDGSGLRIRDLNPEYRKVIVENYQTEIFRSNRYRQLPSGLIPDSLTEDFDFSDDNARIDFLDSWPNPPRPAHVTDVTSQVSFDGKEIGELLEDLHRKLPGSGASDGLGTGFVITSGWFPVEWSLESVRKTPPRTDWPDYFFPLSNVNLAGALFLEKPGHYRNLQIVVSSVPYGTATKKNRVWDLPYFETSNTLSMKGKRVYLLEYRFERLADGTVIDEDGSGPWVTVKELGLKNPS